MESGVWKSVDQSISTCSCFSLVSFDFSKAYFLHMKLHRVVKGSIGIHNFKLKVVELSRPLREVIFMTLTQCFSHRVLIYKKILIRVSPSFFQITKAYLRQYSFLEDKSLCRGHQQSPWPARILYKWVIFLGRQELLRRQELIRDLEEVHTLDICLTENVHWTSWTWQMYNNNRWMIITTCRRKTAIKILNGQRKDIVTDQDNIENMTKRHRHGADPSLYQ